MKEKNQVVPDEVLSKEFLSQFNKVAENALVAADIMTADGRKIDQTKDSKHTTNDYD